MMTVSPRNDISRRTDRGGIRAFLSLPRLVLTVCCCYAFLLLWQVARNAAVSIPTERGFLRDWSLDEMKKQVVTEDSRTHAVDVGALEGQKQNVPKAKSAHSIDVVDHKNEKQKAAVSSVIHFVTVATDRHGMAPKVASENQTPHVDNTMPREEKQEVVAAANPPADTEVAGVQLESSRRKWAYAFLVGGVLNPYTEYRGFLYGVVVAVKKLREMNSRADFVVFIQLSYAANGHTKLPDEEEKVLRALDIHIQYLPKFAGKIHEQFYTLTMEKFRVLSLSNYKRVIFLDSDILPLCNLDYLFELSDPPEGVTPTLKENVVLSWKKEPSNAGIFMVQPSEENYRQLLQIVRRREEEALSMEYPYFDEGIGWGHTFTEGDYWRSPKIEKGLKWDWHCNFADQGLLYYYPKYVRRSVSLIIQDEVEHWGLGENQSLQVESRNFSLFDQFSCRQPDEKDPSGMPSPYRDFFHFTGRSKPWRQRYEDMETRLKAQERQDFSNDFQLIWYTVFKRALSESGARIGMDFMKASKPVGKYPVTDLMYKHLVEKRNRGWSWYSNEETQNDIQ